MEAAQWQRVKQLLEEALALESANRSAYLDAACHSDRGVRQEVESLIASHEQAGTGFLKHSAAELTSVDNVPSTRSGGRIGVYEIGDEIGHGGMGEVYHAIRADGQYTQDVAIKLVRGSFTSAFMVERFRNERQILATLEHPNIARLLDGGTTDDGVPYLVMELIDGDRIDTHCDERGLSVTERLRLFLQVSQAVQYAHQRLVIHRDIKPSNVLVTKDGVPKLLDFGVAKLLNTSSEAEATLFPQLTPEYASPEQIRGEQITTASDVYSLGVVLFHLLTGRSPYAGSSGNPHELARAVCDTEPSRPSASVVKRGLSGDLDNIVLMALRKEPQQRYASVEQFAEDIRRHLEGLPVRATKGSWRYRAGKFARRHKVGMAATTIVLLALIGGVAATIREARIAAANQQRAENRFNDVRKLARLLIFQIHDAVIDLPGSTPARKLIVDGALGYLDDLARESAGDRSLQAELAEGYERVGRVQGGDPGRANLGDTLGALASFQKMIVIRQALVRADPMQLDDQIALARAYRAIADLHLVNRGDVKNALRSITRAVSVTEPLYRAHTKNAKLGFELAADYAKLGDIEGGGNGSLSSSANVKEGLAYHLKSLALFRALARQAPSDDHLRRDVAVVDFQLQNNQMAIGDRAGATNSAREALGIFESLAKVKNNALAQRDLAIGGYGAVGTMLLRDGKYSEAVAYLRNGLQLMLFVVKADPKDVESRNDLNSMRASLALSLTRAGRRQAGLALFYQAFTDATNLYESQDNVQYKSSAAAIGLELAFALESGGEFAKARKTYFQAERIYRSILVAQPSNVENRVTLSVVLNKVASIDLRQRDLTGARNELVEALGTNEPLAAGSPDALYAVSETYAGLGDLALATSKTAVDVGQSLAQLRQASDWYQKSLGAARRIPNISPVDPWGFNSVDVQVITARLAESEKYLAARLK